MRRQDAWALGWLLLWPVMSSAQVTFHGPANLTITDPASKMVVPTGGDPVTVSLSSGFLLNGDFYTDL